MELAITHHLPDHDDHLLQSVQRNDTSSCSGTSEHENAITPGFRFHPTEEELVGYYLRRMLQGHKLPIQLIPTVDLYGYDPWELPAMAAKATYEPAEYWYFFVPRSSRFRHARERPTRLTKSGYWKATGTDKLLHAGSRISRARHRHEHDHHLHHGQYRHHQNFSALRKTLVFYEGRAPRGAKTSWVMDEYRMDPNSSSHQFNMIQPQNADSTICRLRLKRLMRTASTPASICEGAGSIPKRCNSMSMREERLHHDVTSLHFAASTCSPNSTPSAADHIPSKHKVLPCIYSSHSPPLVQPLSSHEERPTTMDDDATASQEFSTLSQSTRSKSQLMRPSSLQLIQELSKSAYPDVRLLEASKSALWTPSPGLGRPEGGSSSLYSPNSLDDLLLNLQSYDISNPNLRNQTR